MISAKRRAFAIVAKVLADVRRARLTPTNEDQDLGPLHPGEPEVLRELEAIETAMREASKVRP